MPKTYRPKRKSSEQQGADGFPDAHDGGIVGGKDKAVPDGGGGNCEEGFTWDAETETCIPPDTTSNTQRNTERDPPAVVGDATEDDVAGSELRQIQNTLRQLVNKEKMTQSKVNRIGRGGTSDLTTERRRTREYLAKLDKLVAFKKGRSMESQLKAKENYVRSLELDKRIRTAKEVARPKFLVAGKETNSGQLKATEQAIMKPAQWMRMVGQEKNVIPSFLWHLNKQQIWENLDTRFLTDMNEQGKIIYTGMKPEQKFAPASQKIAGEAITGPPTTDFMRIMSEQVFVLPNGKVVTPIRQFCEVKVLPPGTKEAFFYDYGAVDFSDITEGTIIPDSAVDVRSAGGATSPRGARVEIKYSQLEESPIDLIAANNRSFALESVNDENLEILNRTYDDDTGSSGDGTTRKAPGGGTKDGRWVNGNDGTALTTGSPDSGLVSADTLTFVGLRAAKGIIEDEGIDPSNIITYASGKQIRDLIDDPNLDTFIGFSRPAIITEATVERIAGTNLVRSSQLASLAGGGVATGRRAVMFVPGIAFGLVTGRDLTMEAQRRNEFQIIHLTGTQKIKGFVKQVEATCRLSTS